MKFRIRVREVGAGMFSTERYVAFEVDGREYSLFVDQESVRERDRTLEVQMVEAAGDQRLIELPRATFNAGSRVLIPKEMLVTT